MIVVAAVLAVALVATVWCFLRHIAGLEAAWTVERRELVNRVQAPERIPLAASEPVELPDREPDEWAQVGRVQVTSQWLDGED